LNSKGRLKSLNAPPERLKHQLPAEVTAALEKRLRKARPSMSVSTNINALIKMTYRFERRLGRPQPPGPGEPVPSVPPVGKADGVPLRYGGLRAA
jgi:hypothetical protein